MANNAFEVAGVRARVAVGASVMRPHRCQGFTADTGPNVLPRDPGAVGGTRSRATSAVVVRPGFPQRKTHRVSLVIVVIYRYACYVLIRLLTC